jgi:hypothetical protein
MQAIVGGGIGLIGGAVLGMKLANDAEEEKQQKAAYLKSLVGRFLQILQKKL